VNDHDFELLSAYLDDELSNEERAVLEQRLQSEADLRRALETLRATVSLVGSLPLLKAPRDFTLKAPPLSIAPKVRVLPRLASLASAAAAVLLFIAGAGILNTGGGTSLPPASSVSHEIAAMPTSAVIAPTATVTNTAVPLATLPPVTSEADNSGEAPSQAEMQLSMTTGQTASDQFDPALAAPTEGETEMAFAAGAVASENAGLSDSAAASESGGSLAANDAPEKTPTPAVTSPSGFFTQATQPPPATAAATASPAPTQTNTTEPPTQAAQTTVQVEEALSGDSNPTDMTNQENALRGKAPENTNAAAGVALLAGGVLLMGIAIGLFIRSRHSP